MGDVNGIGPELLIKAFGDSRLKEICVPIVYGSVKAINIYRKVLNIGKFQYQVIQTPDQAQYKRFNIIECVPDLDRIEIGKPSSEGGKSAYFAVKRAIEDAQHQKLDALITLPVDKASFQEHYESFAGHTEMLAEAFNVSENLMLMVYDNLRVGVATNHLPIKDVSGALSVEKIVRKVQLLNQSIIKDFNIPRPLIALLGLNPHSGDNGLIGEEEKSLIIPAIEQLKKEGIMVSGPYPADGFFGSMTYRKFDGIMAMYHDQGLVPFKLLAGYSGVNFTSGIPLVRTSPDHGVAYDIAGKNIADVDSFRQALYLSIDVYRNRKMNEELKDGALTLKGVVTSPKSPLKE